MLCNYIDYLEMDIEEAVKKIVKGEIKFYKIEEILNNDVNLAAKSRVLALEKIYRIKLDYIPNYTIDLNLTYGRNIENAIGCVQVPLGIAGPLLVNGEYAKGTFYVPLATTEGALVASVNRGCSAITASGGAKVKIFRDSMARAPLFETPSIDHAMRMVRWVKENYEDIKKIFEAGSRFTKLLDIETWIVGRYVWLRFKSKTGDAMGMNMVTLASDRASKYIIEHLKFPKLISLSGNLCVDKKPSAVNWLLGRGKTVVAEAKIKKEIVRDKLKTTPELIVKVNIEKNLLGSGLAHAYGLNAHVANIVAAIFLATGQDLAQIVESSMAITIADITEEGDLYISVTLPSLEVGTVGGGTHLPTQREALRILGCEGSGDPPGTNSRKLAEIIAATSLAGELSLLSALAAGHLARAHEKLGRGRRK